MPPRKDLGAILVDEGVLTPKDLERVRERRPLWRGLIDADLATPEQIFRALSVRFGVPVVADERLAEAQVPERLRRAFVRDDALAAGLLPIDLSPDGQRATVVMIDPSDEATLAEFLTRAQVPEGRALLARREPILRAIERCLGDPTAVVTPLPPMRRRPGAPVQAAGDDDVTGTVKLDPSLQAEISRLPPRLTQAEPLTPLPRPRPRRPTPTPPPMTHARALSLDADAGAPAPEARHAAEPRAPETPSEALRAEERLTRALIEVIEALAAQLEARAGDAGSAARGREMERLSRRVARQLGLGRRAADEIGVAARLYALDRVLRGGGSVGGVDVVAELGWAAAGEGGLLPILRALTAASAGFGRGGGGAVPAGARIIGAVADYLELGAASGASADLDTVSQLLRASPAGAQVVDALLRVLEADRGDKTPARPTTLPATSMLRHGADEDDEPTPPPTLNDSDKTQRKPLPRKEGTKGE